MDRELRLFDRTAFGCSKIVTKNYTNSFYLGIRFLDFKFREPIYAIYAFLRYTDEIVDTFFQHDRRALLKNFRRDTRDAIDTKLSLNPVLHAFQLVVHQYNIDYKLIDAFFRSMEMDLDDRTRYDKDEYETYIYGSAEVVGLMCLRVACENSDGLYKELATPMQRLGAALQKVNFLRDMKSDFEDRGRCYFPGVQYANFDEAAKKKIEVDIESDFDQACTGIVRLPDGARSGIEITYLVYRKLLDKIESISAESLLRDGRVSQSKWFIIFTRKFLLLWISVLVLLSATSVAMSSDTNYFHKYKEFGGAIFLSASLFLYWDKWFTREKVWSLNPTYLAGLKWFGLPIEECLFSVSVPYACINIYEFSKRVLPQNALEDSTMQSIFTFLMLSSSVFGLYNYDRIYTRVVSCAAIVALALHYQLFQFELFGYVLLALAIHYVPFSIVNGILTGSFGLDEPVVYHDKEQISNIKIRTVPIEDAVCSLSWLLTYVSLFEYLQRNLGGVGSVL